MFYVYVGRVLCVCVFFNVLDMYVVVCVVIAVFSAILSTDDDRSVCNFFSAI
jgi:lipoprotein signal peptidase